MTSVLGPDLIVNGAIDTSGDVRILGRVVGPVTARAIVIGPGGAVDGSLVAGAIEIHGTVVGIAQADRITIAASGQIGGELHYAALTAAAGARVEALCVPSPKTPRKEAAGFVGDAPGFSAI